MNMHQSSQSFDHYFTKSAYTLGYLIWSRHCKEVKYLKNLIVQEIETFGRGREALLDIGCGNARLTRRIARMFKSVTFFEPNPLSFSLAKNLMRNYPHPVEAFKEKFPSKSLPKDRLFDTVVAANMLYHVDRSEWPQFFQSVSDRLRPGGILVLALMNERAEVRQVAKRANPDKEMYVAEDLLSDTGVTSSAGLEILRVTEVDPIIRTDTVEASTVILQFLLGNSYDSPSTDHAVLAEAKKELMVKGLSNTQSVITFRKS